MSRATVAVALVAVLAVAVVAVVGGASSNDSETGSTVTTSEGQGAFDAARRELDLATYSKKFLIRALSSKSGYGYSKAEATYAVNHVGADWKSEAVELAKYRLDSPLGESKKGFITLLAHAGFSKAEATYAINHVGPDWNAEAVERAEAVGRAKKSELIQELADAGFTDAQVRWAVEKAH